jgi:hypothetical protein
MRWRREVRRVHGSHACHFPRSALALARASIQILIREYVDLRTMTIKREPQPDERPPGEAPPEAPPTEPSRGAPRAPGAAPT